MANIRWTRLGLAGFEREARVREGTVEGRPTVSFSTDGTPSVESLPAMRMAGVSDSLDREPNRRSNSASVIVGRVKPVRLSGPGIPPRRIELLMIYLPCPFPLPALQGAGVGLFLRQLPTPRIGR